MVRKRRKKFRVRFGKLWSIAFQRWNPKSKVQNRKCNDGLCEKSGDRTLTAGTRTRPAGARILDFRADWQRQTGSGRRGSEFGEWDERGGSFLRKSSRHFCSRTGIKIPAHPD